VTTLGAAQQRVFILGGSGGIGSAFAHAFLQHGAQVTDTDLKPPPDDVLQAGARFEALDVTSDEAVLALSKKIDRLDVLIHCAGRLKRWEEHQPEVFREIVDIHLFGNVRLAAAFRPHLKQTRGCLINIASMYAIFGSPQNPAYGASKAAIVQLTKSLAIAWAPDGIRVNAIAPGFVVTEQSARSRQNPDHVARVTARTPLGRWGEPADIAGPALFLASAEAQFVTGVTLPVDGGYAIV
jgi:NAD(P)-dependent dehydrogenase (short-subunit alcohol dehydrogenase family)